MEGSGGRYRAAGAEKTAKAARAVMPERPERAGEEQNGQGSRK